MKIAIDARLYGLEHAGIGRYLIHLIEKLVQVDKKNQYILILKSGYFSKLELPNNWKKVLCNDSVYGIEEQLRLPGILNKIGADLVHFPHFNVPIFWRGKFIVTIHDMVMHRPEFRSSTLPKPIYLFKNLIYRLVFRHAVNKSQSIIVPSGVVKNEVVGYFGITKDKVTVIHEGFDAGVWTGKHPLDILKNNELTPQKYFTYVGSLYPHKNIEIVVRAIKLLVKHLGKDIKLAVIGPKNVFVEKFISFLRNEKAERLVVVLGFVKDTDISAVYKNSLGLIYPSLSEGFGLQGIEAMSSHTLVACSDIPIFKEIYKENAVYFDPTDPMSVAKKLEFIIKMQKKERESRINKSVKFIKKYSWEKMAKETVSIYARH